MFAAGSAGLPRGDGILVSVVGRLGEDPLMTKPEISGEELVKLVGLMEGSDTVELKLTVPHEGMQSAERSLGIDELEAQIRQVVFFDTPDLVLHQRGLVARARRIQGGGGDTVVKLRPVSPGELSPEISASKHLGIETDVTPYGFVCSASLKGQTTAKAVRRVMLGKDSIKGIFSKKQKAFFRAHAPEGTRLNDLVVLGPVFVLKLRATPKGFGHRLNAEMWRYPDDTRILEISTKSMPDEALELAQEWLAELTKLGIEITGDQHTKTATALKYFSSRL